MQGSVFEKKQGRLLVSLVTTALLVSFACSSSGVADAAQSNDLDARGCERSPGSDTGPKGEIVDVRLAERGPEPDGHIVEDARALDQSEDLADVPVDQDNDGDPDETDCEPLNPAVSSLAEEVCNGYDDNCDGNTDETTDCPDGESCQAGQCQVSCGDALCGAGEDQCNCPNDCTGDCEGCCAETVCVAGIEPAQCGSEGEACLECATTGQTCLNQQCQCECGDGLCCDAETGGCLEDCPPPCGVSCDPDLEDCVQSTTGQWVCAAKIVEVPEGSFWMGCNNCEGSQVNDEGCDLEEHPYHEVYLDSYAIDKTEATASQYGECVATGYCESLDPGLDCTFQEDGLEDHPVNCVLWSQAQTYCMWLGKSLCTEAQWEKAARGGCEKNGGPSLCKAQSRIYPWGNELPTCDLAVMFMGDCGAITRPVCSRSPAGDSPYGLCDMAGNVWEHAADKFGSDYYCAGNDADISPWPWTECDECETWPGWPDAWPNPSGPQDGGLFVRRGGGTGFSASHHFLRVSKRQWNQPYAPGVFTGFRCCRTP